jgi:hypothetical protein
VPYSVKKPADMKSMKEKLQKTYKNISDTAARQAIHVWNSVMEESDDEGRAWASVYAALNKRGLGKKAQENPMPRTLTASDRSALIRLASTLPKGSEERKAILSGLLKESKVRQPTLRSLEDELDAILDDIADLDSEAKRVFRVASAGYLNRSFDILESYEAKEAELLEFQKVLERMFRLTAPEDRAPLEEMRKKSKKALRGLKSKVTRAKNTIKKHKRSGDFYLVVRRGAKIGRTDLQVGDIVQRDKYEGQYGWGNWYYKGYGFKAYGIIHPRWHDYQSDPGYPDPRVFKRITPQKAKKLLEQGKVPSAPPVPGVGKTLTLSEMMPPSSAKEGESGRGNYTDHFVMWGVPARGSFPKVAVTAEMTSGNYSERTWTLVVEIDNEKWYLLANKSWKNKRNMRWQIDERWRSYRKEDAKRLYPEALEFMWDTYFSKHPELGITGP